VWERKITRENRKRERERDRKVSVEDMDAVTAAGGQHVTLSRPHLTSPDKVNFLGDFL